MHIFTGDDYARAFAALETARAEFERQASISIEHRDSLLFYAQSLEPLIRAFAHQEVIVCAPYLGALPQEIKLPRED